MAVRRRTKADVSTLASASASVTRTAKQAGRSLKRQAMVLGGALGAFWGVFAVNTVLAGSLIQYGIIPRTVTGLRGILFAPFLHGNLQHIIANSIPFAALGWLVMLRDRRHFVPVTLFSMLGAGLFAWAFGAPGSVHVGASGVVFGYLGFLLLAGWYARSFASIGISLVVGVLFGGLLVGVLPAEQGISWQAHLGGFIGGVLAARRFRR
jgi:membrane associated rhomboid family serine protease